MEFGFCCFGGGVKKDGLALGGGFKYKNSSI